MTSLNNMIKTISGLCGTTDVNDWENNFIKSILEKTGEGKETSGLSEKQITIVERLYNKHFGG